MEARNCSFRYPLPTQGNRQRNVSL